MNNNIDIELDDTEEVILRLCRAIERKVRPKELKEEYLTLCHQSLANIVRIRTMLETNEYLTNWGRGSVGDR